LNEKEKRTAKMENKRFVFIIIFIICAVMACKESKDLDSIEISAVIEITADGDLTGDEIGKDLYVCESSIDKYRQFKVNGLYKDDSEEDLTDEVVWTSDATEDTVLSDAVPGTVYCRSAFGVFGVVATYTLNTGDSNSSSTDDASNTEFKDSVLIKAR
jgi:hypothetical protein